jgi:hypothetical protein
MPCVIAMAITTPITTEATMTSSTHEAWCASSLALRLRCGAQTQIGAWFLKVDWRNSAAACSVVEEGAPRPRGSRGD